MLLGGLVVVLILWYLWPFVVEGHAFPLGPDGPVYLWWARLAGIEGLSAVGSRPGVPAVSLVLSGSLGLSVVQVTAALEIVLGTGLGLAAFAAVRRSGVGAAALAGLLAGTFGVHLAAGYLSNLAMVAAFVAAIALLDRPTNRAAVVAGLVLAGSGLAHPQFFVVAVVILGAAAVIVWRSDRSEAFRIAGSVLGGGAVVGAGLLAVQVGPAPPDVDTSRDAFLRRAGLISELRSAYLDRFVHRWTRYVQWLSVPLAIVGFGSPAGTAGRILRSWFVVTVVGVGLALVTGWLPADRFITFAFAIPMLAAFGVVRIWRWLSPRRRTLAAVVTAAIVLTMLAGSWIAWNRQEPFIDENEVRAAAVAGSLRPTLVARDAPMAILVDDAGTVSFDATRAGNVVRASLPPDRIRDVVIVVPRGGGSVERRALEDLTASDLRAAEQRSGHNAVLFALTPFVEPANAPPDAEVVEPHPLLPGEAIEPLEPLTPLGVTLASVVSLIVLGVAGYAWARVGIDDPLSAGAAAPAVGAAIVIIAAVSLDVFGIPIGETPGAIASLALSGGCGYLAWLVLERRSRARSAPQVEQQPAE